MHDHVAIVYFFMHIALIDHENSPQHQPISDMGISLAMCYMLVDRVCVKVNAFDEYSTCLAFGITWTVKPRFNFNKVLFLLQF